MLDSPFWIDVFAYVHFGLACLLYVVAVFLCISGCDDFLFDLCHHARAAYRRLFVRPRYPRLTPADLASGVERRTAILIPVWQEEAVIGPMLRDLTATLDYGHYAVFVGTYPNDAGTRNAVAEVARDDSRIRLVDVGRNGPSSKGDCLNAILLAIRLEEAATGTPFEIFVLHDAEDVVHPLELRLFSRLVPRKDMVQLPVIPLEVSPFAFTAAHYMDEFAEHHSKDLTVREWLTGGVPSAGVGCAFSRRAIETLERANGGAAFDVRSLTEDYAAAMTLQAHGLRLVFVRFSVQRIRRVNTLGGLCWRTVPELVGTREYFPSTLGAAVRQKARWLNGIAFQGWRRFGWRGRLGQRYALLRDRKAVATALFTMTANVVALSITALYLGKAARLIPDGYPALVPQGGWLFAVLVLNAFFLLHRVVHRAWYVYRLYGLAHALVSPVRLLWSNYVNFLACGLAFWQVSRDLITGRHTRWAKTAHRFPSPAILGRYRKRMGDIVMERGLATQAQIAQALAEQERTPQPLGQILVRNGILTEQDMLAVVADQHRIFHHQQDMKSPPARLAEMLDIPVRGMLVPRHSLGHPLDESSQGAE